jgi:hypothetical protein
MNLWHNIQTLEKNLFIGLSILGEKTLSALRRLLQHVANLLQTTFARLLQQVLANLWMQSLAQGIPTQDGNTYHNQQPLMRFGHPGDF